MADLGKTIKGLKCCTATIKSCSPCPADCPYHEKCMVGMSDIFFDVMNDALELLKAQEPKPPIVKENAYGWKFFYCPSCGREFNANRKHGCVNAENFCDKCGQAVKWDG